MDVQGPRSSPRLQRLRQLVSALPMMLVKPSSLMTRLLEGWDAESSYLLIAEEFRNPPQTFLAAGLWHLLHPSSLFEHRCVQHLSCRQNPW